MYTRASSIRSNYTTTSTKAKFMIPQRIVGGNDTMQHYNALNIADAPTVKNNNIMNGNHNWTAKSSWPFNQSPAMANGTVVEWQDKKCVCFSKIYCKDNDHLSCTTTMTKATSIPLAAKNNKNTLLEPLANNTKAASLYSNEAMTKNCYCYQGRKTICKENNFDRELCCMAKTPVEWEQMNLCKPECSTNKFKHDERGDNDDDGDDTDFRNEIIRINNIYNSNAASASAITNPNPNPNPHPNPNQNPNANNGEAMSNDDFHLHGFKSSCISLSKYKNDINL